MGCISFSLVDWCGLSKNTDVFSFQLPHQLPHHAAPSVRIYNCVSFFCRIAVFCLKTSMYPHFNQYDNNHGELRHRRAPIQ